MGENLIVYAIPAFVFFVTAEILLNAYEKKDWYNTNDTLTSLALGIGNVITGIFGKIIVFIALNFLFQFKLFTFAQSGVIFWIGLIFADDFSYYWFHRESHHIRFFWASHYVHHSSEKYNLSAALRQTWTGNFSGAFVFWLWMPLVGFNPIMVMMMQSISLLYQFWIHTEAINKMPRWYEFIFNTPSHHRVHHGSDLKYLDKNHAGILIIWDRIFDTFQPELERPTYGLTKNVDTNNPVKVAFGEWREIIHDASKTKNTKTIFNYVFGAPGWSHDKSKLTTKEMRAQTQQN